VQRESNSPLNPPSRLNFKLAALLESIQNADAPPTGGQTGVFDQLSAQVSSHLDSLQGILTGELVQLNEMLRTARIGPIIPPA
jgi:hypothetical protein